MDALIELFEKNDVFWKAETHDTENNEDFSDGAAYSKERINHRQLIEKIKSELALTLKGHALSGHEFTCIINHLSLVKHLSKGKGHALEFTKHLRQILGIMPGYTDSESAWHTAKKLLDQYLTLQPDAVLLETPGMDENELIAQSILHLRGVGYEISVSRGVAVMSRRSEIALLNRLKREFKKLGGHSIDMILSYIAKDYSTSMQRFFLRPEPSIARAYKSEIPWGYLFNLALTEFHQQRAVKNKIEIFVRCVELSVHYFCIQRIQIFSKLDDSYHRADTILSAVQKNISYDQHFSIDQLSSKHAIEVIRGIFKSPLLNQFDVDARPCIEILEWVSSRASHANPLFFSIDEIYHGMRGRISLTDLQTALSRLTFTPDQLNAQYLMPNDIRKRNYFERPLVKYNNQYVYINPAFCSYGFYSTLLKLYQEKGLNGTLLGKITEHFVDTAFCSKGVNTLTNKTYKIPVHVREELQIKSRERECDFIIETDTTIYFIELKRKTLTSEARSGNQPKSLVDLSQSFLHALVQAGIHEYTLRRDGVLSFTDGETIALAGRDVIRISLSMFGFFGVQDSFFVNQIMSSLINSHIQSPSNEAEQEVNEHLLNLRRQFQTEIFSSLYGHYANPYVNCRFMSVPQLLEILENVEDNEQLHQQLELTRRSGTGCKDWFKDYDYFRSWQV